jgi:hypothetical protein
MDSLRHLHGLGLPQVNPMDTAMAERYSFCSKYRGVRQCWVRCGGGHCRGRQMEADIVNTFYFLLPCCCFFQPCHGHGHGGKCLLNGQKFKITIVVRLIVIAFHGHKTTDKSLCIYALMSISDDHIDHSNKACATCKSTNEEELKICSSCRSVWYCSVFCQK